MSDEKNEILEFINVDFGYDTEKLILKNICLKLEKGKTYALVGPTGGGKSTTAGLMVRLYDPLEGVVEFKNQDIRSFPPEELAKSIGFILQEPFLFTGTVGYNITYGNPEIENITSLELEKLLIEKGLQELISKFEKGLDTEIEASSENISLGQKQLIAFIRILLRSPELLILDEATANIDTVTEKLLTEIINKLPTQTTKVIIAHRLNTIKQADQILFINAGKIQQALDFEDAIKLIDGSKRTS